MLRAVWIASLAVKVHWTMAVTLMSQPARHTKFQLQKPVQSRRQPELIQRQTVLLTMTVLLRYPQVPVRPLAQLMTLTAPVSEDMLPQMKPVINQQQGRTISRNYQNNNATAQKRLQQQQQRGAGTCSVSANDNCSKIVVRTVRRKRQVICR